MAVIMDGKELSKKIRGNLKITEGTTLGSQAFSYCTKMAILMDGKQLAKKIRSNLKLECEELKEKGIKPKLAVIMVGNDSASKIYVKNKSKACEEVGIEFEEFLLDESTTQEQLENLRHLHLEGNNKLPDLSFLNHIICTMCQQHHHIPNPY